MPVAEYAGANSYTGNGVTTSFAYSFRILDEEDLLVTVGGVTKTLTTDYTVDGVGEAVGGNVIFNTAPASSAAVVISRNRAYEREEDYQRNGSFDEETVDADFDGIVMLIQQLYADRLRGFKAPIEVTDDQVLTTAMWAARASKLFGFDADGDFGLFGVADFDTTVASAFVLTLLDDATAGAFIETLRGSLTEDTAPAVDDEIVTRDTSATTGKRMTLQNMLKVIGSISTDSSPDVDADFLLSYDASASAAKKVALWRAGRLVQRAYSEYLTNTALTTAIPVDDTKPQITEGTEVLTASITPKSSSNIIRVRFQCFASNSSVSHDSAALFKDSGADALAATTSRSSASANDPHALLIEHEETAGNTTARTYRIRVGPSADTMRLNGSSSARYFGGVGKATLIVEEIQP